MKHITSGLKIRINKACRYVVLLIVFAVVNSRASAQDSSNNNPPQLLAKYYGLKDALIIGNKTAVALNAKEFLRAINGIDYKVISEGNIKILAKDAGRIANAPDIEKQRKYFENLSANLVEVAMNVRLDTSPVYILYCPMKKASWLNNSAEVQNPYYGSSMLTCGELKETIQ